MKAMRAGPQKALASAREVVATRVGCAVRAGAPLGYPRFVRFLVDNPTAIAEERVGAALD